MFTLFVCPTPYFGSAQEQEKLKKPRNILWGVFCSAILCFSIAAVGAIASAFFFGNEKDDTIRHNVDTEETIRAEVKNETVAEIDGDLVKTTEGDSQPVVYQIISSRGRTLIMAKVNTRFCRPSEDSKSLVYAPVVLPPKIGAPSDEDYLAAKWYYNSVQPPEIPEGKVVETITYRVDTDENMVVADYTYVDAPPPSLEEYDAAMEDFLRKEREERGYTTREPDSYLTSNNPRWAADAHDWVNHRDAVMEYALELINAVKRGDRTPPTMEEFLGNIPKIEWSYNMGE